MIAWNAAIVAFATVILGVVAWLTRTTEVVATETPTGFNVLLIIVDDLNASLGCYGHPIVQTPNIDRLARRGVRFDRAYCQYPLCNPSRTSFLSGRRPTTTKVMSNTTPPRTAVGRVPFLPEFFHKHGYFTGRLGKVTHPMFDDTLKWDVSAQSERKVADPAVAVWGPTHNDDADEADGKTARAVARLMEQCKDRRFFIAAGFRRPHPPIAAPQRYFDLYPAESIQLPPQPSPNSPKPTVGPNHNRVFLEMNAERSRQAMAAYYACVTFIDAQVGVLLDTLDRLALADDTVVVLVSDHGFHLGEHGGLWGKDTLFEESAHVPLIVTAPGRRADAVSPRVVELVDLFPTLAELCDLELPDGLEGTSLVPLLDQTDRSWKPAALTTVRRADGRLGHSIRTERWRLTDWNGGEAVELYDHVNDPSEQTNLAGNPALIATRNELEGLLRTTMTADARGAAPARR